METSEAVKEGPYKLSDRREKGYKGRWRYRVIETAVRGPRPRWSLLFTTRAEASTFAGQCRAYGLGRAGELLRASGAREGDGYKVENVDAMPSPAKQEG